MKKQNKTGIGISQLRNAVRHFYSKEYESSITLAGAAEEIFGKMAKKKLGYNAIDSDVLFFEGVAQMLGKPKPVRRKIISTVNRIKNELKHNDTGDNQIVEGDFENEACMQISKAIKNYAASMNNFDIKDRTLRRFIKDQWS